MFNVSVSAEEVATSAGPRLLPRQEFACRSRPVLHAAACPCAVPIAKQLTGCVPLQPDPDERPTARQVFESMRDAAAPMLNWHGSADCLHGGGSSESPGTSNHASGPLHPVQEVGLGA
jgi:hypothetical protein